MSGRPGRCVTVETRTDPATGPVEAGFAAAVARHRALSSPRRTAILHVLRDDEVPQAVDQVAERVGLHVNTAREHLELLVAAGLVSRTAEARATRGRPRTLYAARGPAEPEGAPWLRDQLSRVLLAGYGRPLAEPGATAERAAEALASALDAWQGGAHADPAEHAGDAGPAERAGDPDPAGHPAVAGDPNPAGHPALVGDPNLVGHPALVGDPNPVGRPAPAEARDRAGHPDPAAEPAGDRAVAQLAALREHLTRLGFDPDVRADEVRLRRCPVLDLAHERTDVVCGIHLGLARGVLARVGGPVTATGIEPFAGPGFCVLRLGPTSAATATHG